MTELTTERVVDALENDALIDEPIFCIATLPTRLQAKKDGKQLAELVNTLHNGFSDAFWKVFDCFLKKYRPFYELEFKKAFWRGINYDL